MINSVFSNNNIITFTEIPKEKQSCFVVHNNIVAETLYALGRFLTRPATEFARFTAIAIKGSAGASRLYAASKATFYLLITAIFIASGIFIVGGILRMAFSRNRFHKGMHFVENVPAGYSPPKIRKKDPITAMTYNGAGLFGVAVAFNDLRPAEKRAKDFVHWINQHEEKDLPLFIGLQEAFNQDYAQITIDGLKKRYPYAVHSVGYCQKAGFGVNSGLQFHSRIPILSAKFMPFANCIDGDVMAQKGLLMVELDLGDNHRARVYVTHLQAWAGNKEIRKEQIQAITEEMDQQKEEDAKEGKAEIYNGNYILMGDFNCGNVPDEDIENPTYEAENLRKNTVFGELYDPFREDHEANGNRKEGTESHYVKIDRKISGNNNLVEPTGTFYQGVNLPRQKNGYGSRQYALGQMPVVGDCIHDYILRLPEKGVSGKSEIRNVAIKTHKKGPVSDHLPVIATFFRTFNQNN